MITSNSGDGRSRGKKSYDSKERESYRNGEKREYKPYKKDGKDGSVSRDRFKKDSQGSVKGRQDGKSSFGGQKKDSYRNGSSGNSYSRNNSSGNKPYKKFNDKNNYRNPYDKDEEETNVRPKRQPAKDNKVKEAQPDKTAVINRIEKEKKAMQKKQAERKNSKPRGLQSRPKRSNNIDWTREYENGSYDDDDLDAYL